MVVLDGLPQVAEVAVGVAETVECFALPHLVAEFAVQGQGLLAVGQGLLMVAEQGAVPADRVEGVRLAGLIADARYRSRAGWAWSSASPWRPCRPCEAARLW